MTQTKVLALDVDGVLLDPERGGAGHWTNELTRRYGITRGELSDAFFRRCWDDILIGRRGVEEGLTEALDRIGTSVDVESVLSLWFEADFVPFVPAIEFARRAADAGALVVLATNQEHRRAAFLNERLGKSFPIHAVFHSAGIGHLKHDAAFFDRVSDRLGLQVDQRSSVLFVDDVLDNVVTAVARGWTGVHADGGAQWLIDAGHLLAGI